MANKIIPAIQTNEGNVGIGVTSPRALLDLAKANNVGQVLLLGEVGANIRVGFGLHPSNAGMRIFSLNHVTDGGIEFGGISSSDGSTWTRNHRLGLAGGNSFFNEQGGNVGIGTNNPSAKLEVAGSLRVTGVGQIGPAGGYGIALFNDQTNTFIGQLYGRASGIQFTDGAGINTVYIASGGKVGIGTANPLALLSVGAGSLNDGNVPVQISSAGPSTEKWFGANRNGNYGLILGYYEGAALAGSGAYVRQVTTDPLHFAVNNTSVAMSILSNTNIGIGTTNPSQKLDVNGAIIAGINNSYGAYTRTPGGVLKPWFATASANTFFYNTNVSGSIFWQNAADTASLMVLSEQARLGINTTTPSGRLHVLDTVLYPPSLTWNAAAATIIRSENGQIAFGSDDTAPYGIWQQVRTSSSTARPLLLNPLGGNVGVGVRNPTKKLQVAGSLYWDYNGTATEEHSVGIQRVVAAANGSFTEIGTLAASASSIRATFEIFHHDNGTIEYSLFELIANYYTGTTTDWVQLPSRTQAHYAGVANGVVVDARLQTTGGSVELRLRSIGGAGGNMTVNIRIKSNTNLTETSTTGTGATVAGLLGFNGYEFPVTDNRFKATVDGLFIKNNGFIGIGTTNPSTLLSIGRAGSTTAASGITFGGDAQANLYRAGEDTIKTDGSLNVAGLIYNGNNAYYSSVSKTASANWGQYSTVLGNASHSANLLHVSINGGNVVWAGTFLAQCHLSYRPDELWTNVKLIEYSTYNCSADDVTLLVMSTTGTNAYGIPSLVLKTNGSVNGGYGTGYANNITVTVNGPSPSAINLSNSWTAPYAFQIATSANTKQIYVNEAGRVGIGTAYPVQKFQIDGTVGNPASVGTTQSGIFRISNTTDNATLDFGIRAGGNGAWLQSTDETSLAANYSLLLNPNGGNVGIGLSNTAAKLDVAGTIRLSSNLLSHKVASYTTSYPGINSFGADATDSNITYYNTGKKVPNTFFRGVVWTGKHYIFTDYTNNRAYFYDNNFVQITNAYGYFFVNLPIPSGYLSPHGAAWDGRYLWLLVYNSGGTSLKIVGYDLDTTNQTATLIAESAVLPLGATYDIEYADGHLYFVKGGSLYIYKWNGSTIDYVSAYANAAGTLDAQAITYDGSYLWVTSNGAAVYKVGLDGTPIATISSGFPPDTCGWAWNGSNIVTFDFSARDIYIINTTRLRIDTQNLALMGGNVGIGITNPAGLLHVFNTSGRYINFTPGSASGLLVQRNAVVTSQGTTVLTLANAQGPEVAANRGTALNLDIGYGGTPTTVGTIARGARIAALNSSVYDATAANQNAYLAFYTATAGSLTEKVRIQSNGNVGIGTTSASSLLDVIGTVRFDSLGAAETRSVVGQAGQRIFMPSGGAKFLGNSSTGAIRIKSPVNGSSDSMHTVKGTVFEYSTGKTFQFLVSFYYYSGSVFQVTAQIIGGSNASLNRNFTVRIGRDANSAFLIYIGELADTWSYGYVYITEVFFGWSMDQSNMDVYQTGWSISTEASAFENVMGTVTDTQITNWSRNTSSTYYNLGKVGIGTNNPTTLLSVGGPGSASAASGITLGGDSVANLYRISASRIKTDGSLTIDGGGGNAQALVLNRSSTSSENGISFNTAGSTDWYYYVDNATTNLQIQRSTEIDSAPRVRFNGANSDILFNLGGGNIGVGTSLPSGKLHVVSTISNDTVLRADGTNGTLFSVVDDLSDSLMSVNNSAGLPVLEVFANDRVVMGQYGSGDLVVVNNEVGIGTTNPINKLSVIGNASIGSTYNVAAPANGLIVQGNVGIGSTSPAYKLDCYSTNGVADVARFYNNQTACNFSVGSTTNTLYSNYVLYTSNGNAQFFKNRSSTDWGGADSLNIYTSNGAIAFHPANTANRVYFATDGNVGIGVSTPAQKLDVKGYVLSDLNSNAVAGGFFLGNASHGIRRDAGSNDVRLHTNGGDLIFGAAGSGSQQVTLKNGGNVGIGSINPSYKLEVYSAAKTSEFVGLSISNFNNYDGTAASLVTSQLRFAILETPTDTYNAPSRTFATCQAGNEANNSSSDGFFAISTRLSAVVAEKFRITSAGNVGIGTTNPGYRLNVTGGDINFAGNSILRFGTVSVLNESSNANDIYANIRVIRNRSSTLNDGMYVNYDSLGTTAAHLRFYANGTNERMRIDASNGYVGVGTTVPDVKFDVYDNLNGGNISAIRNASSGSNAYSALVFRRDSNLNGLVMFTNSSLRSSDGGLGNSTIRTDNGKLLLGAGASTYHSLETNGNVGIGLTNPSAARLHIKGNTTDPVLRVETALLEAGTTTSSKTFVAWLPIMTGAAVGDKVFIPLFK